MFTHLSHLNCENWFLKTTHNSTFKTFAGGTEKYPKIIQRRNKTRVKSMDFIHSVHYQFSFLSLVCALSLLRDVIWSSFAYFYLSLNLSFEVDAWIFFLVLSRDVYFWMFWKRNGQQNETIWNQTQKFLRRFWINASRDCRIIFTFYCRSSHIKPLSRPQIFHKKNVAIERITI